MRINDSNLNAVTTGAQRPDQVSSAESSRSASALHKTSGGDRVQLSGMGERLQAAALNSPERESRITELAAAYRSGAYQVDARAVGRSIISDAFEPR